MKITIFTTLLITAVLFFSYNLCAQVYDASSIWIKVYGQSPAVANMRFGNRIGNTIGLDTAASFPWAYREQEPPPHLENEELLQGFDCIWIKFRATLNWGTFRGLLDRDFRDYSSATQKDTFKVKFVQNDNSSATISLKWPDPIYLSAHCDSLILKYLDPVLGTTFINMFIQDSITIPAAGDNGTIDAVIYKTGVRVIETGVEEIIAPISYSISQNYPNPFNPTTDVRYQIAERGHVLLRIYDVLGREVATLVNEVQDAGYKSVKWDVPQSGMPSGVYFYRVQAGAFVETKKMILLR